MCVCVSRTSQDFPCVLDGLLLEVVTKGPIAQHLKECMMICVLADVIQVVVLSTSTDALLCVACTLQFAQFAVGIHCSEEDGLELIHTADVECVQFDD